MVGQGRSLCVLLSLALLVALASCGGLHAGSSPASRALASPAAEQNGAGVTPRTTTLPVATAASKLPPGSTAMATGSAPGCRLFVLAGQSNMGGRGRYDELPSGDDGAFPPTVRLVAVSLDVHLRPLEGRFGPELSLARALAAAYPGETLLLVKYAVEGSSLLDWAPDWDPQAAALTGHPEYGPLYQKLLALVAAGQEDLPGGRCLPAAAFWMQGERDALFPEAAAAYEANLAELVHALRRDLGAPGLPCLVGQVDPPRDRYPMADVVRAAQAAVARAVPRVSLVRTEGLSRHADGLHYDTAGQLELGRRLARAYLDMP